MVRKAMLLRYSVLLWLLMPYLNVAAEEPEQVADFKDWSVLADGSGNNKYCYAMTWPKKAKKNRKPYLLVAHQPGQGVRNQVEVNAGVTFKPGSMAHVKIGKKAYALFTEGDGAWAESAILDNRIVSDMRRGNEFVFKALNAKGKSVKDSYSLMGFTAAMKKVNELCP